MTPAVAYIRVSTDEQSLSIEVQRNDIADWCSRNDMELVGEFVDEGLSGAVAPMDRPALVSAIDAAITGGASIVVQRRDRLSRDRYNAALIGLMLRKHKRRVFSTDRPPSEEDDPEARAAEGVADVIAEYERALISRRTKRALATKRARGEPVGRPPYGYEWADGSVLRPCAAEQSTIRIAQRLRHEGMSFREVAVELDKRGRPPRSGRAWNPDVVRKIAGER